MNKAERTAHIIELQRRLDAARARSDADTAKHQAYDLALNQATTLIAHVMGQTMAMAWAIALNPNIGRSAQELET